MANTIDPRPKRRKDRDNPYEIYTTGAGTTNVRHYIRFKDGKGDEQRLEIDKKVFDLLDEFELEDLRFLNEYDRHYEHMEHTEGSLHRRLAEEAESVENAVLRDIQYAELHNAIRSLSPIQKRRIILYYFCDYKLNQIAAMEGSTYQAVSKSILAAEKKLKKILSEG